MIKHPLETQDVTQAPEILPLEPKLKFIASRRKSYCINPPFKIDPDPVTGALEPWMIQFTPINKLIGNTLIEWAELEIKPDAIIPQRIRGFGGTSLAQYLRSHPDFGKEFMEDTSFFEKTKNFQEKKNLEKKVKELEAKLQEGVSQPVLKGSKKIKERNNVTR